MNAQGSDLAIIKGAPEVLLPKSGFIVESDGMVRPLSAEDVEHLVHLQNEWCVLGRRVLLVCVKRCAFDSVAEPSVDQLEAMTKDAHDLCLLGMVGLQDKARDGLSGVVAKVRAAGIRVCMMTGDHALTATSLAFQIGLLTSPTFHTFETMQALTEEEASTSISKRAAAAAAKNGAAAAKLNNQRKSLLLTGSDLAGFEADDWQAVAKYEEVVFARVSPEQKLNIVKEFQNEELIVGVIGDGKPSFSIKNSQPWLGVKLT